jgi:S1-C subfamily serine protease
VRLAEIVSERYKVPADLSALAGITLGAIGPGSPLYGHVEGAVILEVAPYSKAARAGLRPGDIIVSVNQEPVKSPREVIDLAGRTSTDLLLQIMRGDHTLFVVIE